MTIKTRSRKVPKAVSQTDELNADKAGEISSVVVDNKSEDKSEVFLEGLEHPVTGRSVFAVRTLGNTVSVESAFIEESGNVLRLPAVFPNRQYALEQIDELRQIVNQHFDELGKSS